MDQSGIMNAIVEWGNANAPKLEAAYATRGGWEGWVQVELAIYLQRFFQQTAGATITVTREEHVYQGTDQRSDLLITTRVAGRPDFTNMFELKAESILGGTAFPGQVARDCAKINNGLIRNDFRPCRAWVVAFSVTRDLNHLQVGGRPLAAYSRVIQAGNTRITLWWGSRDFP